MLRDAAQFWDQGKYMPQNMTEFDLKKPANPSPPRRMPGDRGIESDPQMESFAYRGHLPLPFYNAKEENYDRRQYPSEPRLPRIADDVGNYGRGGYYGNTYDQDSYTRERTDTFRESYGYRDNYRKLGDRRGSNADRSWEEERSTRTGYRPLQERLESHRGKGPRSYRRSDERILQDVNDRLYDDPYVDATDVEVNVRDGEVFLTGTVEDLQSKRRAEDIGQSVSGVRNVENSLRVRAIDTDGGNLRG